MLFIDGRIGWVELYWDDYARLLPGTWNLWDLADA